MITIAGLVLLCVAIMLLAGREPRSAIALVLAVIALLLFVLGGLPLLSIRMK